MGKCSNKIPQAECQCKFGYSGKYCEIKNGIFLKLKRLLAIAKKIFILKLKALNIN